MSNLFRLWFGFARPVLRRDYLVAGVGLMTLKYGMFGIATLWPQG